MKNILWASLLAASASLVAGCHDGTSVITPVTVQTMQARVVESQQQQMPVGVQSTGTVHCQADRCHFRTGDGSHPAGAGARGRQSTRRTNAGRARRCSAARPGGTGTGGSEGCRECASRRAEQRLTGSEHVGPVQAA